MPSTGETCYNPGVFRTDCRHREEARFGYGDTFTPCPYQHGPVNWTWVRP